MAYNNSATEPNLAERTAVRVNSAIPIAIHVNTRADIPPRLIVAAAKESTRRQLDELRGHIRQVHVRLTDRRLYPGTTRCQVDVEITQAGTMSAYCVGSSPVDTLTDAFDQVSQDIRENLDPLASTAYLPSAVLTPPPHPVAQPTDLLTNRREVR